MSSYTVEISVLDIILLPVTLPVRLLQSLVSLIQRLLKQNRRPETKLEPQAHADAPDRVVVAPADPSEKTDAVRRFVADCFVISPRDRVTCKALHETHVRWCGRQGVRPLSKSALGGELGKLGFGPQRSGIVRSRKGLRLRADKIS